jgi:hypothetical protein
VVVSDENRFLLSAQSVTPQKAFNNADVQKWEIIKEIKGKAGVYR